MRTETITTGDELLIRRLVLEPGEATPWHTDVCRRFTVVVRGDELRIEYRDTGEQFAVAIQPGMADWDEPTDRVHRAVNTGSGDYEEVVTFFLESPATEPQPEPPERGEGGLLEQEPGSSNAGDPS